MSKQRRRRQHRHPVGGPAASPFTPVAVRPRHDGWTPVRQNAFIRALAETACVEEACAAVGMSARSAYGLRARADAGSFRQAWDVALDYAVTRLADAMMGRALHGVAVPIFYQGEQIGERRRYDERLGMFILRARAPERYGKWRDGMTHHRRHPDGAARVLQHALRALAEDNLADAAGRPRRDRPPLKTMYLLDDPAEQAAMEAAREEEEDRKREAEFEKGRQAYVRTLDEQTGMGLTGDDYGGDVARSS